MVYRSEALLMLRFIEGQVWSVLELFGYMELSILAILTGEPPISMFPYRPWEGISPREDVESKSFVRYLSDLATQTLLRGIQGLFRTSRALLRRWSCHTTYRLAKVTFGAIASLRIYPPRFRTNVFTPQAVPLTHRRSCTRATRKDNL